MKSTTKTILSKSLIVFFLLIGMSAYAQLTVTGEVRPRYEFRNGFKTLRPENNFTPASFVEQRTRLYFNYKKEKLTLYVAFQDVRLWGNHNQIYKTDNDNLTNLFQGYALYELSSKWSFKLGRQVFSYDTQRFLGGLDWAQQGRSHDAIMLTYKTENGFKVDGAYALNNNGTEPTLLNQQSANNQYARANYKNMQFIHASKKWENAYGSLVFQNDGRINTTDAAGVGVNYRQTIGLVANGKFGENMKLAGEAYYQMGKNGADQEISAYFANLQLTFLTDLTPITIGGDYASGTSLENAGQDNAWNPLYGTNHKWYGFMDYFYVGNPHGQYSNYVDQTGFRTTGLIDIFIKTNFRLADRHTLAFHGHYFMSPVTLYSVKPLDLIQPEPVEISSGLGVELDFVYKFVVNKEFNIQVGYSHMLPTESMEAIKNSIFPDDNKGGNMDGRSSTMNNWAFIMIQFKPELFSNKKADQ